MEGECEGYAGQAPGRFGCTSLPCLCAAVPSTAAAAVLRLHRPCSVRAALPSAVTHQPCLAVSWLPFPLPADPVQDVPRAGRHPQKEPRQEVRRQALGASAAGHISRPLQPAPCTLAPLEHLILSMYLPLLCLLASLCACTTNTAGCHACAPPAFSPPDQLRSCKAAARHTCSAYSRCRVITQTRIKLTAHRRLQVLEVMAMLWQLHLPATCRRCCECRPSATQRRPADLIHLGWGHPDHALHITTQSAEEEGLQGRGSAHTRSCEATRGAQ